MNAYEAFYAGRNAWFPGEKVPRQIPENIPQEFHHEWKEGLRQVLAEERLNQDTDWD